MKSGSPAEVIGGALVARVNLKFCIPPNYREVTCATFDRALLLFFQLLLILLPPLLFSRESRIALLAGGICPPAT